MKILINLIGGQPVPNYLAAKEIQPDKILNIYSSASDKIMERLNKILGIEQLPSLKVNPFDFNQIYNSILDFAKNNNDEIVVNITGGTKIMSIAAFEVARQNSLKSIYIDSENHLLYEFYKDAIEKKTLEKKITIKEYFNLHGFLNVKESKILYNDDETREIEKFDKMISANPGIVTNVLEITDKIGQNKRKNKKHWFKENVIVTKGKNIFEWKEGRGKIIYHKNDTEYEFNFTDEKFLDYHNGKWFEKEIFSKIKKSGKYDEVIINYEIYNDENVLLNELDIVAIRNEKLDIYECKSGGLFQDDLNKLKAIKDTLGRYSKIHLITYFKIQANTENEIVVRQKLNDYKIKDYFYFNQKLDFKVDIRNANL